MFNIIKHKVRNLISDKKFTEILTGSVWALSARVISAGLGLAFSIIIARFYGADVLGIVAVLNSFLMMATIFTVLGTNTSILRLIPEHLVKYSSTSAFKVFRKILFLVIGSSLVTGIFFFFGANLIANKVFGKPHLSFYFAMAAVFIVFKSLMLLNTEALRGLKLVRIFALMQILPQGSTLLLLLLLGFLLSTIDVPIYAMLGGYAMTGLMGWLFMEYAFRKKMQPNDQVESMPLKDILSLSLPMLMTATMSFVIGETGVIMLGIFRNEAEVGYYAIAVKLATLTTFVLGAINSMAAAKFSELFHNEKMDELFHVAKKSTKLIFWTTMPILFFLIILGKFVLWFLFGQEFTTAYWAMFFLVLGQFVNSISGSTGYFMNMTGHQKVFRNIILTAAIMNILLNFALIPYLGIYGAALSGMTCLIFWNVSILVYIKMKYGRTIGYFPWFKHG